MNVDEYLSPSFYIDSDNPVIAEHARSVVNGCRDDSERAVKLYYSVRDGITYNPYALSLEKETYTAGYVLGRGEGFCVQKAILLAALSRAAGVPCRLRFANVRNHLVTPRLRDIMKTDLFVFHGYNEFFCIDRWVKATAAFNSSLCRKFHILPLDFNGRDDSVFHPFDSKGNRHMEYVHDYGSFPDFPYELMVGEFKKYYPHFFQDLEVAGIEGSFEDEIVEKDITG